MPNFSKSFATGREMSESQRLTSIKKVGLSPRVWLAVAMGLAMGAVLLVNKAPSSIEAANILNVSEEYGGQATIDQTATAYIAAAIAEQVSMPISGAVLQQATNLDKVQTIEATTNFSTKPYIATTALKTIGDIKEYTVVSGDTVAGIAEEHGITSETIRSANDMQSIAQPHAGDVLKILPLDGVLHTVTEGDTVESVADKYEASATPTLRFNDAEVTGLVVGSEILVPGGRKPLPVPIVRTTAAVATSGASSFYAPQFSGNGYSFGYCTWYAANRRADIGAPIPSNLGNASTWYWRASSAGWPVGDVPQSGAVLWYRDTSIAGGLGHVAYVESVNADGSFLISEMNYTGWNSRSERTIPASETGRYGFLY